MAEGWKQIWEDLRAAVRGAPAPRTPTPENPVDPAQAAVAAATPPVAEVTAVPDPATSAVSETTAAPLPDGPALSPDCDPVDALPAVVILDETEPAPADDELSNAPLAEPPRPQRWRQLALAGLLGALLFFGWQAWQGEAFWTRWTAPTPPAEDVIASFTGGQIKIADVEEHLKLLVPAEFQAAARSPETLLGVAEDLAMDELVRRWAANRQPDSQEDFRHTMQHINESINLESLDAQRHAGDIQVQESEIQDYYNTNKAQFGEQTLTQVREQIRQTLVAEREQGYIETYMQRLKENASITRDFTLLAAPAPTEDELRRYYDANLEQFKTVRQVQVDELQVLVGGDEAVARRTAADALLKVRSGASFGEVAQAISGTLVTTATLIPEGSRDPAWHTAVNGLALGEVSDVFRAGDTFSIVRLLDIQRERTQTLDEVRTPVRAAVEEQKTAEWFTSNGSKTLFTLKGKQFTLGEFYTEYQELPPDLRSQFAKTEGMTKLAEQLIERLLLVEDAYDQLLNVQNQPLVDEARLQVLKQMLHQEEVDDKIAVTDEELQTFYDQNPDRLTLPPKSRIRYIRIGLGTGEDEAKAARARADEAYAKLAPGLFQPGAEFATVAQEYSEDATIAAQGGLLPEWLGESEDPLSEIELHWLHEMVLNYQPGDIIAPFDYGGSLYIVEVLERTAPELFSFDQAKPYIEQYLKDQKHHDQETKMQEQLLQESNFVVYQSVLAQYFQSLPTPTPFGVSGQAP